MKIFVTVTALALVMLGTTVFGQCPAKSAKKEAGKCATCCCDTNAAATCKAAACGDKAEAKAAACPCQKAAKKACAKAEAKKNSAAK